MYNHKGNTQKEEESYNRDKNNIMADVYEVQTMCHVHYLCLTVTSLNLK